MDSVGGCPNQRGVGYLQEVDMGTRLDSSRQVSGRLYCVGGKIGCLYLVVGRRNGSLSEVVGSNIE